MRTTVMLAARSPFAVPAIAADEHHGILQAEGLKWSAPGAQVVVIKG